MINIKDEKEKIEYQNKLADNLFEIISQRLEKINYEKEMFSCKIDKLSSGEKRIAVKYNGKDLAIFNPFISNAIINGKIQATGMFLVPFYHDGLWYGKTFDSVNINVDEYHKCTLYNNPYTLQEVMEIVLPISQQNNQDEIEKALNKIEFKYKNIKYDTLHQRYIIDTSLTESIGSIAKPTPELRYFKYMSLETYMNILKNKKFRMNSIVSMNDSSESFFLGDYLCNAYYNSRQEKLNPTIYALNKNSLKYDKTVEYKNTLITSFSTLCDDSLMWRLYGDNGKGVCVEYTVNSEKIKPVLYIDEKDKKITSLKNAVKSLESKNIRLYFNDINNYQFFTKSSQFEYEKEYRLLMKCSNDKLEFTKYHDTISFYHDFDYDEIAVRPRILYVGANLPNMDINFPLLVDLSKRELNINLYEISKVDTLRL